METFEDYKKEIEMIIKKYTHGLSNVLWYTSHLIDEGCDNDSYAEVGNLVEELGKMGQAFEHMHTLAHKHMHTLAHNLMYEIKSVDLKDNQAKP